MCNWFNRHRNIQNLCMLASCGKFKFHRKLSALSFQIFLKISTMFVIIPFSFMYYLCLFLLLWPISEVCLYLQCFSSQILALFFLSVGFSILLLWSFSSSFSCFSCYFPTSLVGCFCFFTFGVCFLVDAFKAVYSVRFLSRIWRQHLFLHSVLSFFYFLVVLHIPGTLAFDHAYMS